MFDIFIMYPLAFNQTMWNASLPGRGQNEVDMTDGNKITPLFKNIYFFLTWLVYKYKKNVFAISML